jgi:hypothetical protein
MRKWVIGAVIVIAGLAVMAGGAAFAAYQMSTSAGERSRTAGVDGPIMGWQVEGWGSTMGRGMMRFTLGPGGLHEELMSAIARGLGLSEDDLAARLEEGESLDTIAEAEGLTDEELQALWTSSWEAALASAVEDGSLTETQADWILQHIGSAGAGLGLPMMGVHVPGVGRRGPVWGLPGFEWTP